MRKRILDLIGLGALLLGALALIDIVGRQPSSSDVASVRAVDRFSAFPVGKPQSFDFDFTSQDLRDASDLERRQQAADWMLMAVIGDAGLPIDGLQKVLFDLPPARFDFLEGISSLEYGETRSRSLENGEVVALIPADDPARQRDYLAAVADKEHKNIGSKPKVFHVFEYGLDEDSSSGTVTRLPDVSGDAVFSSAYGYVEQPVSSRADLERFMTSVDDLTGIQKPGSQVIASGRKIPSLKYRGIRFEDVSGLWQAEKKTQAVENAIAAFDAKWSARTYRTEFEKQDLLRERDQEWKQVSKALGTDAGSERMASHTGFSLDPVFDYDRLRGLYAVLRPRIMASSAAGKAGSVEVALDQNDEGPFLSLLYGLGRSGNQDDAEISKAGKELLDQTQFQHARYDGDLKGTEVGMILFYTDLLAKLYALDYTGASPERGIVPGFVSLLHMDHASIYDKEMLDRSNTRLWFGVLDEGFQAVESGILFARTSTRVYAAGSDPLQPGKESEPNVESARFLGWWNDHYETLARFEPEYQRLNEVMKWSLAFAWLKQKSTFESLDYLGQVEVKRTARFPEWVRQHPSLRFERWDRINFFPPNYKDVKTESLPLLESETWNHTGLSGGVSLASKQIIAERPVINRALSESLRRPNLIETVENGNQVLRRVDKTAFEFQKPTLRDVTELRITPRAEAKLRGREFELKNQPVRVQIAQESAGLRVGMSVGETRTGALPIGDARVVRTRTGFRVGLLDEEFRTQNRVFRALSDADSNSKWAAILEKDPAIDRAIFSKDGMSVAVRMNGTDKWNMVQLEGAASTDLPSGANLRFASVGGSGRSSLRLKVRPIESEEKAIAELGGGSKWNASSDASSPKIAKLSADPPPPGKAMPDSPRTAELGMDQREATRLLIEDGYPAYVSERSKAIAAIDRKIAQGKLSRTDLLEVDAYCRRFQHDPAVQARGAIAKAEGGDHAGSAADLNGLLQGGKVDAVEQALKGVGPGHVNANAIRDAVALRKAYADPALGRDVVFLPGDDGLRVEIRLADLSQSSERYTAGGSARPLVYDGSPAFVRTTEKVATEANATRRLTNWDAVMPPPDQIRDLKTGTLYHLSSDSVSSTQPVKAGTSIRFPRLSRSDSSCSSSSQDSSQPGCQREIVLRTLPPTATTAGSGGA